MGSYAGNLPNSGLSNIVMIPSKTIWLVTYLIFNKKYVSADSLGRNLCRIVFPKRFSPSWVFCAHRPITFSQSVTTGLTSESSRVRLKPISTRCQIEESPSWGVEVMAWRRDRGDYFLTSTGLKKYQEKVLLACHLKQSGFFSFCWFWRTVREIWLQIFSVEWTSLTTLLDFRLKSHYTAEKKKTTMNPLQFWKAKGFFSISTAHQRWIFCFPPPSCSCKGTRRAIPKNIYCTFLM